MEEVVHAMKSPCSSGYVCIDVPESMNLDQMREVVRISKQTFVDVAGAAGVPGSFAMFPINRIGHSALMLLSRSMPRKLADGVEGSILLDISAAFNFMRQVLDRVASRVQMRREDYVASVVSYCIRFTPHFADAVRMRLPVLVKQAFDSDPPVLDMAQRLSKLSDIALTTIATLRSIVGDATHEEWLKRRYATRAQLVGRRVPAAAAAAGGVALGDDVVGEGGPEEQIGREKRDGDEGQDSGEGGATSKIELDETGADPREKEGGTAAAVPQKDVSLYKEEDAAEAEDRGEEGDGGEEATAEEKAKEEIGAGDRGPEDVERERSKIAEEKLEEKETI